MQTPKPRLAVVATRGLADLVRAALSDYTSLAEWRLIDRPAEEALGDLRSLWQAGLLDAVVAAGANAQALRAALPLPVATIQVTGFDVLLALQAAHWRIREELQGEGRVVILTRRPLAAEFEQLAPLLTVPLDIRTYLRDEDARQTLVELAAEGERTVIIGSSLVVHWAQLEGLSGVILYSAQAVRRALDDALELARLAHMEEIKRERLDAVVQTLSEGVVAVDADERIETLNPAMVALLGVAEEWAVGRRLSELVPTLSLAEVLKTGEARRDQVETVGGKTLVTQRLPIMEQGRQAGAVLTFQDAGRIERADRQLRTLSQRRQFRARYTFDDLVGESPAMQAAREFAVLYATSDAVVLIQGESGTGKERFAQGMHNLSARQRAPFVAINCAAFPESLLESELFGYEEGAFTGSRKGGKAGLIELAHTGTLFLDEIGDMPLPLQTRLLRVLQEREVVRLGGVEPVPVDIRVIAATHRDLRLAMEEGRFRADLFYRLNILNLTLPPLRERIADLPRLTEVMAQAALARFGGGRTTEPLKTALLVAAAGYGWPGNVRELENVVERCAVFYQARGELTPAAVLQLAPELARRDSAADDASTRIRLALAAAGGDQAEAARRLGISRTTLWRRLKAMGAATP